MRRACKFIATTLFSFTLIGATVSSQELTLDDCIDLALKNRAVIVSALGSEQLAKADKTAALGAFLPRLNATFDWQQIEDLDYEVEAPSFADPSVQITDDLADVQYKSRVLNVTATQPIVDFGVWNAYSAAKLRAERASLDVIGAEQDLIYSVKLSYFGYLAEQQNVDVQAEAVKRSEEQLKLIESRFELGSASRSDVLRQKVRLGNDRLALLRANNAVTTAKALLAYTIGVDPRQEWSFSTDYQTEQFEGSAEDAVLFALENQPGFLSTLLSTRAAEKDFASANAAYLPSLSAYGSFVDNNSERPFVAVVPATDDYEQLVSQSDFSNVQIGLNASWRPVRQLPTFSAFAQYDVLESEGFSPRVDGTQSFSKDSYNQQTIGFRVSWDLFENLFSRPVELAAEISRNNARAFEADARNLLIQDIRSLYANFEVLREQLVVSEENVESAAEDLKITQERYDLGAATILDLLESQVSLKTAEVSLVQVRFDLNLAVANLENAMGKI